MEVLNQVASPFGHKERSLLGFPLWRHLESFFMAPVGLIFGGKWTSYIFATVDHHSAPYSTTTIT